MSTPNEEEKKDNVTPIRRSLADEVRGKIAIVAAAATEADHKSVAGLIEKAKNSVFSVEIYKLSPGMSALLFMNHNGHNRAWNAPWIVELARRMREKLWKQNSMSGGVYTDGNIGDMQHRLGGSALAGFTLEIPIVFGIQKSAVDTIDGGKKRSGADAAGLDGIENAARKQQIVKMVASYTVKMGDSSTALKSEAEVKSAIEDNNDMLDQSIEIGEKSLLGKSAPVLKGITASMVAYLMLKTKQWPVQRIHEKLALFQTGLAMVSEKEPFYVVSTYINAKRKKAARGEKLTVIGELAAVIYAMVEAERGVKAIDTKHVKAAAEGKTVPSPAYPEAPEAMDAAE